MIGLLISIVLWYILDNYTDFPWWIKFCIVLIVLMMI
jgi:hypothetical protein